jgi:uncharacterized protein YidB (DUF937 family)
MAILAGMPSVVLLERLCRLLPPTVHAMTPEGERDAHCIPDHTITTRS